VRIDYLFDRPLPAHQTDSEQVLQTVASLARAGHDVTLVLPVRAGGAVDADALREHYRVRGAFAVRGVPLPRAILEVANLRKLAFARAVSRATDTRAELLYTRNIPVLIALSRGARPFAYETYRPWFDQRPWLGPSLRHALSVPSAVGTVLHSHYAAERYARLGLPREALLVAHNGHDPESFASVPEREVVRRELGLAPSERVVVYTGHVNFAKGIDSIAALARCAPETRFLVVGWNGKPGLATLVARRASNLTLVPWQPFERVAWYLKAADVLLLPPKARGFSLIGNTVLPIKLFQYLAAARPILAPDTPDTRELLVNGYNAQLFSEGRIDRAREALEALFTDPALAQRLANGARATVSALTWDARAQKLGEFLERRLARR
jgi:glycosyltransferase involved in cell wall biosynthesis